MKKSAKGLWRRYLVNKYKGKDARPDTQQRKLTKWELRAERLHWVAAGTRLSVQ